MKRNLLFILIISVFTILVKYEFAISDQRAQIPLIINEINPDYLTHDFFVSVNETYGPRFYYSKFMAVGCQLMTIPGWFLFLSIFCGFTTAWLTYLTFKEVFYQEHRAVLASIFVLVLPTPTLAESTFNIYENVMTPSALVLPMLIGAFYSFFKNQKLFVPMILVGIASLFQVLYGLTTGLLILFAFFCTRFLYRSNEKVFYSFGKLSMGILILGLFVSASMIPYYMTAVSSELTSAEFVEILAFRGSHHYIPSTFPLKAWLFSIAFFGTAYLAAFQFAKTCKISWRENLFFLQSAVITSSILFGFVLGYIFVEIIPSRLVTTAQTFRYVVLLKWFACLFIAAWIPIFNLRLSTVLHPMSLFLHQILSVFTNIHEKKYFDWLMLLITIALIGLIPLRETIMLLVAIFIFGVYLFYQYFHVRVFLGIVWTKQMTILALSFLTLGLAITPFISQRFLPGKVDNILSKVYPKYNYQYLYEEDLKELSLVIEKEIDEKETLIVPPDLSDIRYSANRAIVVDFKAIPFQDKALIEFRDRLRNCYGETDKLGFEAQEAMKEQYLAVTYEKLQSLKADYSANYAVVEAENNISKNIIFKNESYKLIRIE